MSSKRYPEEFKVEAVKQVVERGHSVAEVSELGLKLTLGIPTHRHRLAIMRQRQCTWPG